MSTVDGSDPAEGPGTGLPASKPTPKSRGTLSAPVTRSKTPARTDEVVEIDDNDDTWEPQANASKPKPKPKRASLANQSPKVPGQVRFPAELSANLAEMFREFFRANDDNTVPVDIYYMQVPWIFRMHNAKNKQDATVAAYYHGATGHEVMVRAFSLPWMLDLPGGRNSQRLLVASGPPFTEPVILARIKKGSSEFRIWRGVNDDPYEQAVVVKKMAITAPTSGSMVGYAIPNTNAAAGDTQGPLPPFRLQALSALPPAAALITRKRKRDYAPVSPYPDVPNDEEDYIGEASYGNALVPADRQLARYTAPPVLSPTAADIAHDIVFRFHGIHKQERVRSLYQSGSFTKLVTNAIVGGVIVENDAIQILNCEWCISNGQPKGKLIADEEDFDELMTDITEDRGWNLVNAKCFVDVMRKTW